MFGTAGEVRLNSHEMFSHGLQNKDIPVLAGQKKKKKKKRITLISPEDLPRAIADWNGW